MNDGPQLVARIVAWNSLKKKRVRSLLGENKARGAGGESSPRTGSERVEVRLGLVCVRASTCTVHCTDSTPARPE